MNINISVHLYANENKVFKGGSFKVIPSDFKKDPDWTAAITAYEWIRLIKKELGYSHDFMIDKVLYNEDIDITELVHKVEPINNDDLPF